MAMATAFLVLCFTECCTSPDSGPVLSPLMLQAFFRGVRIRYEMVARFDN